MVCFPGRLDKAQFEVVALSFITFDDEGVLLVIV